MSEEIKNILEAALMCADGPMTVERLQKVFPEINQPEIKNIEESLEEIKQNFENRPVELKKVSSGWRFQVRQQYAENIQRLHEEKPPKYSRAVLETMALIAYRQPITRAEIEEVRGVAVSTYIIRGLLDREWVRVIGHREVPGRPALYASTKKFLDYFNLASLEELPTLSELKEFGEDEKQPELDQTVENLQAAISETDELIDENMVNIDEPEIEPEIEPDSTPEDNIEN